MTAPNPMDDELLRNEIQAAIKAGRDLNPEMDSHLADSVLDRYRQEAAARARQVTPAPTPAPPARPPYAGVGDEVARVVLPIVGVIALIAILTLSHGAAWWLIFFLPGLFGFWGRGYSRRARYYDRTQRFSDRRYRDDDRRYLGQGSDRNPNDPNQPISMV
ncbi:MAG TPA: hypothetical protein VF807_10955 [Ktedonobacterales bacterium]